MYVASNSRSDLMFKLYSKAGKKGHSIMIFVKKLTWVASFTLILCLGDSLICSSLNFGNFLNPRAIRFIPRSHWYTDTIWFQLMSFPFTWKYMRSKGIRTKCLDEKAWIHDHISFPTNTLSKWYLTNRYANIFIFFVFNSKLTFGNSYSSSLHG